MDFSAALMSWVYNKTVILLKEFPRKVTDITKINAKKVMSNLKNF